MSDKVTIKVSKKFIEFWSRLNPDIQKDETIKLIAVWAWQGGMKEQKESGNEGS